MSEVLAPPDEAGIAAVIAAAHAAGEPLAIEGNGTKRGLLRPVQAARTLSTRAHSGITFYRPSELVISARAGTPISEIEAALAEKGQHLIAEPPPTGALFGNDQPATIGGIVAANLSGPRRIAWGAMRDHVLGMRFVNGVGEVIRSGGRVLKNVTGLDLCKLLTGAHGTLGVITEVTLKVLPAPETQATIAVVVPDARAGVRALAAGLGSPYGVSGAAFLPDAGLALLRLEDFAPSVAYRAGRLAQDLSSHGEVRMLEAAESRDLWRRIRDAEPLAAAAEEAVWRVSVRPSAGPEVLAAATAAGMRGFLDWGGGLVWLAGPATAEAHAVVMRAATAAGGNFVLFRAPEPLRLAVPVLPEEPPPLADLSRRVKAALDPAGILNPGRMRAGL